MWSDILLWLWFAFIQWLMMLSIFYVIIDHLYVLCGEMSIQILCQVFNWVAFLLSFSSFYIMDVTLLPDIWFANRVKSHYSQILYMQIWVLTKICDPKIDIHGTLYTFTHMYIVAKKTELPNVHIPRWGQKGDTLPLVSTLRPLRSIYFVVCLMPLLKHFCLIWWFCCLKRPLSVEPKCYLVFLNSRSLWCALRRKYVLDKLNSGMSYNTVGCEFKVNESAIYIK